MKINAGKKSVRISQYYPGLSWICEIDFYKGCILDSADNVELENANWTWIHDMNTTHCNFIAAKFRF